MLRWVEWYKGCGQLAVSCVTTQIWLHTGRMADDTYSLVRPWPTDFQMAPRARQTQHKEFEFTHGYFQEF